MEHGHDGAGECARIIYAKFGVKRTPEAVRRHAYRIGAPIIAFRICTECGGKTRKPDEDGRCPTCHQKALAERYRLRNTAIVMEIRELESGRCFADARRDYDRARQEAVI